jgi:hypothetical protein
VTLSTENKTHRVVKFIVNVKLVEKSVKSHVGSVIVVNVTDQKRILGKTRRRNKSRRPDRPRKELVCGLSGAGDVVASCERAGVVAKFMRALNVSDILAEISSKTPCA